MLILEFSQGCYGRTDGSVTISLRNFVGEGIIRTNHIPCKVTRTYHLQNPLKDVDSRMFIRMLRGKN